MLFIEGAVSSPLKYSYLSNVSGTFEDNLAAVLSRS